MTIHRNWIVKASALTLVALAITGIALGKSHHKRHAGSESPQAAPLLAFSSMYGVDGGFVGAVNPIRGIIGDELPWQITGSARGLLSSDGRLRVRVRGLVFTNDPEVPPELQGINDETQFRAVVSCMSEDATGAVVTSNVTSAGFPASPEGNSDIDAQVTLPSPCIAPIIFVIAGSEDKWFAVTGFEAGSGGTGNEGDDDHDTEGGGDDHGDD
jgi:hypothetical protein